MTQLKFKIIGKPIAKGRPRFYNAGNYTGTYTPTNTRKWEDFMRYQALRYRPKQLWEGPIIMALTFFLPRPKSLPKRVVHHMATRPCLLEFLHAVVGRLGVTDMHPIEILKTGNVFESRVGNLGLVEP